MFGQPPKSSAFVHTQHLPASFPSSAPNMQRCAILYQRGKPFSHRAIRACPGELASQQGRALSSTCQASYSGRNADSDLAGGGSSIPQPQASNAGLSSTNTGAPHSCPPSSSKGITSALPVQANGAQQPPEGPQGIAELRSEVSKLSELVTNQARMLSEQVQALEQARSLINMHSMTSTLSATAPTQTIKAGWNPDIKPFEVQRSAIGDRRYLGGYDARFHSTNK